MRHRNSRGSGAEFRRRALWYWYLDQELSAKTRFFGAAALTNRVLARLFEHHPNAVSKLSGVLLMQLGRELELVNTGLADFVREGTRAGPELDRLLVEAEQGVAQIHWQSYPSDRVRRMVEREFNELLNQSHISGFVARLWKDSRDYCTVLTRLRERMRAPLNFAVESHRVDIGCALIEHLCRDRDSLKATQRR